MNNKRILSFLMAFVLSLGMTTGAFAGNISDDIQARAPESPIASVSERGVTVDIKNVVADKACIYVLYKITLPEDISLDNDALWLSERLDVEGDFKLASSKSNILSRNDNSITVLHQHFQSPLISGKKATFTFEDFGYFDIESVSPVVLIEGRWVVEFELNFIDTIDLNPNIEVSENGITGTLESVSISPISIHSTVTAPGEIVNGVVALSPVITFKDGSQTIYNRDLEHLSGRCERPDLSSNDGATTIMDSSYIFEDSISLEDVQSITLNGITMPVSKESEQTTQPESPSDWAKEQISAAVNAGIVPNELLASYTKAATRAEFCALAVKLYETVNGTEITERKQFSDTDDINVQKMAGLGIAQGVGGDIFSPEQNLTREQAATLLARLAEACNKTLENQAPDFADNSEIAPWAADAVGQVQKAAVMSGVGENRFAPQGDYTREQSIMTMMRLFNLVK